MKTLHKYILSEILKSFAVIVSGIIVFIMVSNLIDELPVLLAHKPSVFILLNYYVLRVPFLASQAIPFAMLLSILFVFSQLGRNNELTAMKSAGIDFRNIAYPVVILSLLVSMAAVVTNETLVSKSYEKAAYIKDVLIEKKSTSSMQVSRDLAKLSSDGKVFYIKYFDGLVGQMKGVCILEIDKQFNITYRLDAKEGVWQGGIWNLKDGVERRFEGGAETDINIFKSKELHVSDAPEDFVVKKQNFDDTLAINIFRLRKIINTLKSSGFKYTEEEVNFHLKIAYPFATFILSLLGISIPFMFSTQRSFVNAAIGFVVTIIVSFFYMGFVTIGLSMGKASILSPVLSAWISNIFFAGVGVLALLKVKR
ncbi:MAG TPA: LptF/LptG family permease [Candidatus Goldiibacteriota bacterium]|nr:LptF/LptG family permease [Candidatus Goldiibacteriota bacterium]HPN65118.1 LptF/LptG family permease [Candidatus Goldiibacteriota bacterium]HRQ44695.1 LptF/LptG family permease [Candidatus Goldiibacteriota bacterium]